MPHDKWQNDGCRSRARLKIWLRPQTNLYPPAGLFSWLNSVKDFKAVAVFNRQVSNSSILKYGLSLVLCDSVSFRGPRYIYLLTDALWVLVHLYFPFLSHTRMIFPVWLISGFKTQYFHFCPSSRKLSVYDLFFVKYFYIQYISIVIFIRLAR